LCFSLDASLEKEKRRMSIAKAILNVKEVLKKHFPHQYFVFSQVNDPIWWLFAVSSNDRTTDILLNGQTPQRGRTFVRLVLSNDQWREDDWFEVSDSPLVRLANVQRVLLRAALEIFPLADTDPQSPQFTVDPFSSQDKWNFSTLRTYLKLQPNAYQWRILVDLLQKSIGEEAMKIRSLVKTIGNILNTRSSMVSNVIELISEGSSYQLYTLLHSTGFNQNLNQRLLKFSNVQNIRVNIDEIYERKELQYAFSGRGYAVYDAAGVVDKSIFLCLANSSTFSTLTPSIEGGPALSLQVFGTPRYFHGVLTTGEQEELVEMAVFIVERILRNLSDFLAKTSLQADKPVLEEFNRCVSLLESVNRLNWSHNDIRCDYCVYSSKKREWRLINFSRENLHESTWLASSPTPDVSLPKTWDIVCLLIDALFYRKSGDLLRYVGTRRVEGIATKNVKLIGDVLQVEIKYTTKKLVTGATRFEENEHMFIAKIDKDIQGEWTSTEGSFVFTPSSIIVPRQFLYQKYIVPGQVIVKSQSTDEFNDDMYATQYEGGATNYLLVVASLTDPQGDALWRAHRQASRLFIATSIETSFLFNQSLTFAVMEKIRCFASEEFDRLLIFDSDGKDIKDLLYRAFTTVQRLYKEVKCIHHGVTLNQLSCVSSDNSVRFFNLRRVWHFQVFKGTTILRQAPRVRYPQMERDGQIRRTTGRTPPMLIPSYDCACLFIDVMRRLSSTTSITKEMKNQLWRYMNSVIASKFLEYKATRTDRAPFVGYIGYLQANPFDIRIDFDFPEARGIEYRLFTVTRQIPDVISQRIQL
jgi:hypothetical protein